MKKKRKVNRNDDEQGGPSRRWRDDRRRSLAAELEERLPVYATMRRSLEEKRHVAWQRDRDAARRLLLKGGEGQRRYSLSSSSSFVPLSTSFSFFPPSSSSSPPPPPIPPPWLPRRPVLTSDRHRCCHPQWSRLLEGEFANAYSTGRPGSTYGYNMFWGISWAEASTSCPPWQNCLSGQSDECITPGHECWAFTECDTRNGKDGLLFSKAHGVTGAENLAAVGVGAVASGGYVNLDKPSYNKTNHSFCGAGYKDTVSRCTSHCPSGNLNDYPPGGDMLHKDPVQRLHAHERSAAPQSDDGADDAESGGDFDHAEQVLLRVRLKGRAATMQGMVSLQEQR